MIVASISDLICQGIIRRATQPFDAASRYVCTRSGRTLWVEPDERRERSVPDAPRYLVDDGDGTRTFYRGEDLGRAVERLLTYSKFGRRRVAAAREDRA